jgi:hypothetical protein
MVINTGDEQTLIPRSCERRFLSPLIITISHHHQSSPSIITRF